MKTDNENRQYDKDARDIIASSGVAIDENFKIHKEWLWWYEYCGYAQFYLNKTKIPDISIYKKLVDIDLKLGIDHTQHLVVAMKAFGRKMQHEEVLIIPYSIIILMFIVFTNQKLVHAAY